MKRLAATTAPEISDSRFSICWRIVSSKSPSDSNRDFEFNTAREIALELFAQNDIVLTPEDRSRLFEKSEDRAPCWPDSIVGSITHKHSVFGVAIARKENLSALGIDTEAIFDRDTAERLANRILTVREMIASRDALDITLIFSAKEALYKALYPSVKRFFGFQEAATLFERSPKMTQDDGVFQIELLNDLNDQFKQRDRFEVHYSVRAPYVYTWIAIPVLDRKHP